MNCSQIREKLVQYLDGECTCYEQKQIATHLSSCPECRKELNELNELTALMWEIPSRAAPPGFLEEVMAAVKSREMPAYSGPVEKTLYKPSPRSPGPKPTFRKGRWEILRDLSLAAAVSLAVFWYGGGWFSNENIVSAGSKLDLAFKSYVQYSSGTLNRVYSNVEDLNGTILKER